MKGKDAQLLVTSGRRRQLLGCLQRPLQPRDLGRSGKEDEHGPAGGGLLAGQVLRGLLPVVEERGGPPALLLVNQVAQDVVQGVVVDLEGMKGGIWLIEMKHHFRRIQPSLNPSLGNVYHSFRISPSVSYLIFVHDCHAPPGLLVVPFRAWAGPQVLFGTFPCISDETIHHIHFSNYKYLKTLVCQ